MSKSDNFGNMTIRQTPNGKKGKSDGAVMTPRGPLASQTTHKTPPRKRKKSSSMCSISMMILMCFLSSMVFFYMGIMIGMNMERNMERQRHIDTPKIESTTVDWKVGKAETSISRRTSAIDEPSKKENTQNEIEDSQPADTTADNIRDNLRHRQQKEAIGTEVDKAKQEMDRRNRKTAYLKERRSKRRIFAPAYEFVDRTEFVKKFESLGVPMDPTEIDNERVMIIYNSNRAYPSPEGILNSTSKYFDQDVSLTTSQDKKIKNQIILSVDEAVENCNQLQIIMMNPFRENQCTALVGQYESFYIQKFMRASLDPDPEFKSPDRFKIDPSYPLRPVNRNMKDNGGRSMIVPNEKNIKETWEELMTYLPRINETMTELKPITEKVAKQNSQDTVIVMVCNMGHSELLMNFVCNARSRGLEKYLANILVFATDLEAHKLATEVLGLTSYYNENIFGSMPKQAAYQYGDHIFQKMMLAKVYCVHLVSMLGHDLLFQDVDIVWYKNPLEFFHNNKAVQDYDMVFQDDGARGLFYAPYSANTGFYYVRNNEKTRNFFNSFLMTGERILAMFSHQVPLVQHLSEHTSLFGLRVKIWERDEIEFPGGHTFHSRPGQMKKIAKGEVEPYIFHQSWTDNKGDKIKYLRQMGHWYLKDECQNVPKNEILQEIGKILNNKDCCLAEPTITCHYKDKPSIIQCPDAPTIDADGKSFW